MSCFTQDHVLLHRDITTGCDAVDCSSAMPLHRTVTFDAAILRRIALCCEDPGALALTCKAACEAVTLDAAFSSVWFQRWHGVLAPFRPWQYAAVTWRRMQGATSQQLAEFLLECCSRHMQQSFDQQLQQHPWLHRVAQQTASTSAAADDADRPVGQDACQKIFRAGAAYEIIHTAFPVCAPLPSTLRAAKQWLRKGAGVRALLQLCPASGPLLLAYAAKAGNRRLIDEVISWQREQKFRRMLYPYAPLIASEFSTYIEQLRLMFYAAVSAKQADLLRSLLQQVRCMQRPFKKQLLSFVVRRGNAACLQEMLSYIVAGVHVSRDSPVAPEHLAIAAGRTDPWAAEVVALLLKTLRLKQMKPFYMKQAYLAACKSSNFAILQQLLDVALSAPQQHLWLLLAAGGAACTPAVLDWALVGTAVRREAMLAHDNSSSSSDDAPHRLQQSNWHSYISLEQTVGILGSALPGTPSDAMAKCLYSKWTPLHHTEDEIRLQMADQLWQHLVVEGDKEVELRRYLQESNKSNWITETIKHARSPQGRVLLPPWHAAWLLQKQLLVTANKQVVGDSLVLGICAALSAGRAQAANKWFHLKKEVAAAVKPTAGTQSTEVFSSNRAKAAFSVVILRSLLSSRVAAAAAEGDVAKLQQLELLALFLQGPLLNPCTLWQLGSHASIFKLRPRDPLGLITMYGLIAQGLGICLELLETLLLQAIQHQVMGKYRTASWATAAAETVQSDLQFAKQLSQLPAEEQLKLVTARAGSTADYIKEQVTMLEQLVATDAARQNEPRWPVLLEQLETQLEYNRSKLTTAQPLHLIPQLQPGPLPLWQHAALVVAANHNSCHLPEFACNSALSGLLQQELVITATSSNSDSRNEAHGLAAVQRILSHAACGHHSTQRSPWAKTIARTVIITGNSELLRWSTSPAQYPKLWGTTPAVVGEVMWELIQEYNPISNKWTSSKIKQQEHLQQYHDWLARGTVQPDSADSIAYCSDQMPQFAQAAVDVALPLLSMAVEHPGLLSVWLKMAITRSSSAVDLMRAKAVLAAVAAAKEIPAGALLLEKAALQRHIVPTGDIDLISLLILWAKRLPLVDVEQGEDAAADAEAQDEAGVGVEAGIQVDAEEEEDVEADVEFEQQVFEEDMDGMPE